MSRLAISTRTLCFALAAGLLAGCGQNDAPGAPASPTPASPSSEQGDGGSLPDRPETENTQPASAEPSPACSGIRASGYCGVLFGMSADQAREAYDGSLTDMRDSTTPPEEGSCYYLNPDADSYDIGFMVENGIVARLDIRGGATQTVEGARIGTSIEQLTSLYPQAEEQPNKYTDYPNIVVTMETGNRLIFETDESGTVTRYRAGMPPQVDYVEGCL